MALCQIIACIPYVTALCLIALEGKSQIKSLNSKYRVVSEDFKRITVTWLRSYCLDSVGKLAVANSVPRKNTLSNAVSPGHSGRSR